MTNKIKYGGLAAALALLAACSTDFDITAPWKQIPVVYGILSPQDTAHYIRVEKAFLDQERSALEVAQIADSLYFDPTKVTVYLERASNNQRAALTRVDGNLEGYVRDQGPFASQPNWLYKLPAGALGGIEPGITYRLVIEETDGDVIARSQTTIPDDDEFRYRMPTSLLVPTPSITIFPSTEVHVEWQSDPNAVYFDLTFLIPYREYDASGNQIGDEQILEWRAARTIERTERGGTNGTLVGEVDLPGRSFYQFLADNLAPVQGNYRIFRPITLRLDGGGKELQAFYQALSANSGLTGAEFIPITSNIENGIGVFTSKNTFLLSNVTISDKTLDSLAVHPLTQALGFQ
jgi:hypothetical protein